MSPCLHVFLDASSHLYMKVCPSVRPSVPMSVRPLAFKRNRRKRRFQPARRILLPVQACSILFYFLSSLQFWIPRVQLMFCAENPEVFAKRVRYAFKARRKTESLLRYHLYIDCMPMDGLGELSETSFMKMLEWAKGTGKGDSFLPILGFGRQVASRSTWSCCPIVVFSRVHATLQVTMSVCRLVGLSVCPTLLFCVF